MFQNNVEAQTRAGERMNNEGAMMPSGKRIKIIKQAERGDSQAVGLNNRATRVRGDHEETKRDAVSVVTEWVRELRRKKSEEATNGFASLFGNAA
jgi:hypothetical protein